MKLLKLFNLIILVGFGFQSKAFQVADTLRNHPFNNSGLKLEARVDNLISLLSLKEKAGFLSGESLWRLQGIKRLGIPSFRLTDCGHGITVILDQNDNYIGCATSFPTAVGQAATWDPQLIFKAGAAIAREARATGASILLGPMVNLHRIPVGGRNFETYSEDPYLTGKLAAAFINGVQSEHIGAVIKSFAANNQQKDQGHLTAEISKKALNELYFPAFRIAIHDADPVGVMTAYNGVNGKPTSESGYLIQDVLEKEWNYKGFVISDWRAVVSGNSIPAGLDIEMPGPARFMDSVHILEAVRSGILTERDLNDRVGRYLRAIIRSRLLDKNRPHLNAEINTQSHRNIAREVAEGSIVLLKNKEHLLPLNKNAIKNIAVFGPNALVARLGGGGSASVTTCQTVSPLTGLNNFAGGTMKINFAEGASFAGSMPVIPAEFLSSEKNGQKLIGLKTEFYDGLEFKGPVKCERTDKVIDYSWGWTSPCDQVGKWNYSVRWTGAIKAPETGNYKIGVSLKECGVRLYLDGKLVINEWGDPKKEITEAKFVNKNIFVQLFMQKGSSHSICMEFHKKAQRNAVRLEWEVPGTADAITEAVKLAKTSEVAIIYAGLSNLFEGGSNDKVDLELPGKQNDLIEAISAVNPNTIVVLNNGTPVTMPWLSKVKAVIEAFYPGQEGGDAIAKVIFGAVNPSGKLPDTYPIKLSDVESMKNYPGKAGNVAYNEGIFIGYRQFERDHIKPLFPFGYGLSYTTFKLTDLSIRKLNNDSVRVFVKVTNTGKLTGAEVVQVYVHYQQTTNRPLKELKGFAKVMLAPGESKTISVDLDKYAFSLFDEKSEKWVVQSGNFELNVGNSSDNITLKKTLSF